MKQHDLPLARRTDHDSSHQAAATMKTSGRLGVQLNAVLALVRGKPDATSRELYDAAVRYGLGLERHAIARRLPDLEKLGQVASTRHPGKAITWRAKK